LRKPKEPASLRASIRAAQGVAAEAQGVGALVDLEALGGQELERLEIAEAVGVAVGEAVDEDREAPQVEVVAEAGAADRDLALVGRAEPGLHEDPRHQVEGVLQVRGPRLLDRLLPDHAGAAGHPLELLAGFLLAPAALVDAAPALHHDRSQDGGGRLLGQPGARDGEHAECEDDRQMYVHGSNLPVG
jgi:hypothetical protein